MSEPTCWYCGQSRQHSQSCKFWEFQAREEEKRREIMSRNALEQIQASMAHLTSDQVQAIVADLEAHGVRPESTVLQACRGVLDWRANEAARKREAADKLLISRDVQRNEYRNSAPDIWVALTHLPTGCRVEGVSQKSLHVLLQKLSLELLEKVEAHRPSNVPVCFSVVKGTTWGAAESIPGEKDTSRRIVGDYSLKETRSRVFPLGEWPEEGE